MGSLWHRVVGVLFCLILFFSCGQSAQSGKQTAVTGQPKIISLNGALSEWLCVFGLHDQIIATDVTSNYPAVVAEKPKLGYARTLAAEGILSHGFDVLIGVRGEVKEEVLQQVIQAGHRVVMFTQDHSVTGTLQLGQRLKEHFAPTADLNPTENSIREALAAIVPFDTKPRVLFVYARGGGTVLIAGRENKMQRIMALAGAAPALVDFEGYKPLTAEALVQANPDIFLLFEEGLQSMADGRFLLQMPGVDQTVAGRRGAIVTMEGQLLSGFGPRLGEAVLSLNKKLHAALASEAQ